MTFVSGTTVIVANDPVTATISGTHVTGGKVGPVTFTGTLSSPEPMPGNITGNFTFGTTIRGTFAIAKVQSTTTGTDSTTITAPVGTAYPIGVTINGPRPMPVSVEETAIPAARPCPGPSDKPQPQPMIRGTCTFGPTIRTGPIPIPSDRPGPNPWITSFEISGSLLPQHPPPNPSVSVAQPAARIAAKDVVLFRDGVIVKHCTTFPGSTVAIPDPCVTSVTDLANGNAQLVVLSSGGGVWAFGHATVPSAPLSPSAVAGKGRATVKWKVPTITGGSAITGYTITPYVGTAALAAHKYNAKTTTQTITGLTKGKHYTFKVAARNSLGTGPKSVATKIVTPS
jgi:hypothetical protein